MALSFACCGMSMAGLENLLFDRLGDIAERAQAAATTNTTSPAPSQLRRNCPSSGGLKLASDDEDNGANKQGKGNRHEKSQGKSEGNMGKSASSKCDGGVKRKQSSKSKVADDDGADKHSEAASAAGKKKPKKGQAAAGEAAAGEAAAGEAAAGSSKGKVTVADGDGADKHSEEKEKAAAASVAGKKKPKTGGQGGGDGQLDEAAAGEAAAGKAAAGSVDRRGKKRAVDVGEKKLRPLCIFTKFVWDGAAKDAPSKFKQLPETDRVTIRKLTKEYNAAVDAKREKVTLDFTFQGT